MNTNFRIKDFKPFFRISLQEKDNQIYRNHNQDFRDPFNAIFNEVLFINRRKKKIFFYIFT
jgi:hypothetical protein